MKRFLIKQGDPEKKEPGTWSLPSDNVPVLCCPRCGFCVELDHEISAQGGIHPSVICPNDCGFHAWVKLEGWKR